MRAIALAILLAGLGIEIAIRRGNNDWNDSPPITVIMMMMFAACIVCLIGGW